jgi:hypothetical protein
MAGSNDGISEAASEKRKRGRPAVFDEEYLRIHRSAFPGLSRRGMLNACYRTRAINLLEDHPEFAWLVDPEAMKRGEPGAWQPDILAELGRIEDDELLAFQALVLCKEKPSVKAAVAQLRRSRLGSGPAPRSPLDDVKTSVRRLSEVDRKRFLLWVANGMPE